jgi:hypothetical protein
LLIYLSAAGPEEELPDRSEYLSVFPQLERSSFLRIGVLHHDFIQPVIHELARYLTSLCRRYPVGPLKTWKFHGIFFQKLLYDG